MKKIIILSLAIVLARCTADQKTVSISDQDKIEIRTVLKKQLEQWNAGSIDGFMEGYWKDTALSFCTKKGETKGWDSVCARYKRSYNTKAKMGNLQFNNVTIAQFRNTQIAESLGTWVVFQDKDTASGKFCLYWQKMKEGWRIVADHTW